MSRSESSILFILFATLGFGLCGSTTRGASIPVIHTLIAADGKEVRCQLGWNDRQAFDIFLAKTLNDPPATNMAME